MAKKKLGFGRTTRNARYSTGVGANLHTSDNKVASQLRSLLLCTNAVNIRRTLITASAVSIGFTPPSPPYLGPKCQGVWRRGLHCVYALLRTSCSQHGDHSASTGWILRCLHRATIHPTHVQNVGNLARLVHLGVIVAALLHQRDVGGDLITEGLRGSGDFLGACWAIARTNFVPVTYYGRGSRCEGGVDSWRRWGIHRGFSRQGMQRCPRSGSHEACELGWK